MNKLDQMGYFKSNPEFYKLWLECWAQKKDRKMIDKILHLAKANCHLSNLESEDFFGYNFYFF